VHLVVLSLEPQVEQVLLDEIGNSVRKLELASVDGQTEEDRQ